MPLVQWPSQPRRTPAAGGPHDAASSFVVRSSQWWSIPRYVAHLVTCHIHHDSGGVIAENTEPSQRFFQVQTTLEPAAVRAISRRTRFEGEASADEAFCPGSGAVQVSGRWKRAIWSPTTRPVRKTYKAGFEIRTAMLRLAILAAVRSPLALSELRTAKIDRLSIAVLALTSPGPLRPPADDLPPR